MTSKKERQAAHRARVSRRLGAEVVDDIVAMIMLCQIAPDKEKVSGIQAILVKYFNLITTELQNGTVYENTVNRFYIELARAKTND